MSGQKKEGESREEAVMDDTRKLPDGQAHARAVVAKPGTDVRRRMLELMANVLDEGRTVITGTFKEATPGQVFGRVGDRKLIIKRRATREEFIAAAPAPPGDVSIRAPFYWEVVIES